jgi:hypothetical protein
MPMGCGGAWWFKSHGDYVKAKDTGPKSEKQRRGQTAQAAVLPSLPTPGRIA